MLLDESESDETDDEQVGCEDPEATFMIDVNPNESVYEELKEEKNEKFKPVKLSSRLKPDINTLGYIRSVKPVEVNKELDKLLVEELDKELNVKSVIGPGFEQQFAIKPYRQSRRQTKKKNREERERTTGPNWFNMPAAELTEEKKRDLLVLQMRKALDPKRFYKKNDSKEFSRYFQVGTVIDNPADFYHSRIPKKDRKRTFVEELLADAEFKKKSKKKYIETIKNNPKIRRNMKKNKLKKEFKSKGGGEGIKTSRGCKKHAKRLKKHKK